MHGCYVSARNRGAACTSRSDARTMQSQSRTLRLAAARARRLASPQLASRERTFQRPPEKPPNGVHMCLSSASEDLNSNLYRAGSTTTRLSSATRALRRQPAVFN